MKLNELVTSLAEEIPEARSILIGGIPAVITEQHNEVMHIWENSGLKSAMLLHVDQHEDMEDHALAKRDDGKKYYENLLINDFICAGAHYGTISSPLYWINPYYPKDFRTLKVEFTTKEDYVAKTKRILWDHMLKRHIPDDQLTRELGSDERPIILDIDLDAFSCINTGIYGINKNQSLGYEKRIEETIELLSKLKKPHLITITRSQRLGGRGTDTYVRPDLVNDVQEKTIAALSGIYGK